MPPSQQQQQLRMIIRKLWTMRSSRSSTPKFPVLPPSSYPYEITLGSTTRIITTPPKSPNLVSKLPQSSRFITQSDISVLEWMLRKETLHQDMFLIGPPGAYKRRLVQLYGYLMQREVEVLQISRDTTEADIKQRREIRDRSVVFHDQASVRSALEGRLLVLDGIEKAERNVLPILNNLLENREMNLEDGRHLIPHTRYDTLALTHGQEYLKSWKLERVSEDFRVIALGLPVPAFKGNPLDPPLRSRFQAKRVTGYDRDEMLELLLSSSSSGSSRKHKDAVTRMVDLAYGINMVEGQGIASTSKLPYFVIDNLFDGARLLDRVPSSLPDVFQLMYPFNNHKDVHHLVSHHLGESKMKVDKFNHLTPPPLPSQSKVLTLLHNYVKLNDKQRAPLLYGSQASGKSTIVNQLVQLLNRPSTTIQVYKDMSVRELFQTRTTDQHGNTTWTTTPLVDAAIHGHMCVLDGLENLHVSVVGLIGRLVGDRTLVLPDGVTVLGGDGDLRIHEDFQLIGIMSDEVELTPEMSSVFMSFNVELSDGEVTRIVGNTLEADQIVAISKELRELGGKSNLSLARALSVGQVKRICERIKRKRSRGQPVNLFDEIMNACLGEFIPTFDRVNLRDLMARHGVVQQHTRMNDDHDEKPLKIEQCGSTVKIGSVQVEVETSTEHEHKIPRGTLFFDINSHVKLLESMVDDFMNGDHLMLIGNQGVGKNKLVDRMLELIGKPREYIQLHRDTTVHTLTTHQRIEGGVIKVEDSPLVHACVNGLVLVVDEADKAPAHVTACLKSLAERGEIVLPDGRVISSSKSGGGSTLQLHPDFRMIVLGNRPGFPFLGNSFYNVMSHLFSVYAVGNPGVRSEVELLRNYGPKVQQVDKVVRVFSSLRSLSNDGVLNYPYSLREAVHVVRHLDKFPGDVAGAFSNVFDFDRWSGDSWVKVKTVVEREFGDNVLDDVEKNKDAGRLVLKVFGDKEGGGGGEGGMSGRKELGDIDPKEGKFDPTGAAHVGGNTWAGGSGGVGTAGLGGVGGPYRLSDGNPVFEISPHLKKSITPEMMEKARALSRQLYDQKLKELEMSKYDANVYEAYLTPIASSVEVLRNILDSLQSQAKERKWVKHQTQGDLDDTKLIEGLIGDKNVYKSRQEMNPEVGDPQQKPKLLRLLVDCSASMYRFNGYDKRLDRTLSCVLMVLEAFKDKDMFNIEVFGHSGDGYDYKFCGTGDEMMKSERGRLEVMKRIYLHSQFCMSGDSTLEGTYWSLKNMNKHHENYDEMFLVVLSDANFERYGISAGEFKKVLADNDHVRPYFVFIGSLGDQADRLVAELGGKGLTCMDAGELPSVMQRVFTEGVLS